MLLHPCPGTHRNLGTIAAAAILRSENPAVPMAGPYLTARTQPAFSPGLEEAGRHVMPWLHSLVWQKKNN